MDQNDYDQIVIILDYPNDYNFISIKFMQKKRHQPFELAKKASLNFDYFMIIIMIIMDFIYIITNQNMTRITRKQFSTLIIIIIIIIDAFGNDKKLRERKTTEFYLFAL